MLKRNKRIGILITIGVAMFTIGIFLYNRYNTNRIYDRVLQQDGYQLYEIQNLVTFTVFIDPEWIPTRNGEEMQLNKELCKINNVSIVLERTIHRGNDIYFVFDAIPVIGYKEGEFLSHYIINQDGTSSMTDNSNMFHVYNNKNSVIDVGQHGFGPSSQFSFGLNIENYDLFADGFYMDYNSSIIYGYYRIE